MLEPKLVTAKIVEIRRETPTVKSFLLDTGSAFYRFLPGQWIDLHLDVGGRIEIGGYSPTSSPLQQGLIELAVRRAYRNPVSRYLYEQVRPGDKVGISEGQGEFVYRCNLSRSIVLICGGIGLTPLMSIIRYTRQACPDNKVHLLYSIREPSEFLYRNELTELEKDWPSFKLWATVTGATHDCWQGSVGRIDKDALLQQEVDFLATFYLCGPSSLINTMAVALSELGISTDRILFESWSI